MRCVFVSGRRRAAAARMLTGFVAHGVAPLAWGGIAPGGVPVVPVLVDGAAMPLEKDLPPSLSALAYRNAVKVDSGVDFHQHVDRLVRGLDMARGSAKKKDPAKKRRSKADKSRRSIEQSQASQVDNVPTDRPVRSRTAAAVAPIATPMSAPLTTRKLRW